MSQKFSVMDLEEAATAIYNEMGIKNIQEPWIIPDTIGQLADTKGIDETNLIYQTFQSLVNRAVQESNSPYLAALQTSRDRVLDGHLDSLNRYQELAKLLATATNIYLLRDQSRDGAGFNDIAHKLHEKYMARKSLKPTKDYVPASKLFAGGEKETYSQFTYIVENGTADNRLNIFVKRASSNGVQMVKKFTINTKSHQFIEERQYNRFARKSIAMTPYYYIPTPEDQNMMQNYMGIPPFDWQARENNLCRRPESCNVTFSKTPIDTVYRSAFRER